MKDHSAIANLFDGQKPFTQEPDKTYKVKVHVVDMGWVEVETRSRFIVNGMLEEADEQVAAGRYTKCNPPKRGECVVSTLGFDQ